MYRLRTARALRHEHPQKVSRGRQSNAEARTAAVDSAVPLSGHSGALGRWVLVGHSEDSSETS